MRPADRLALLRIALAVPILLVASMLRRADPLYLFAFALFVVAVWTDIEDGRVARRDGTTALGAFLDPLADKAVTFAVLLPIPHAPFMSGWIAALLVREAVVTALRVFLALRGVALPASPLAKAKTATLFASAGAFLLAYGLWASVLIQLGELLLAAGTILAIASVAGYPFALRHRHA